MHLRSAAHHRRQAQRRERWHDALASAIVLIVTVLVFWLVPAKDSAHAHGLDHESGVSPWSTFHPRPAMTAARLTRKTLRHPPITTAGSAADVAVERRPT